MITPSPTAKIDPTLARGILGGVRPATATRPAYVLLSIPNTSYELHLIPTVDPASITTPVGKRIIGIIRCQARRIDAVGSGGRFVEPVMGRPQRVQGSVIAVLPEAIVVNAGIPIHVTPAAIDRDLQPQSPAKFEVGQFVSFDALEGATFSPQA